MPGLSPRDRLRGWFTGQAAGRWFTAAPGSRRTARRSPSSARCPTRRSPRTRPTPSVPQPPKGRIRRFREETRARRVEIAREAEHRFRRKVSWGATCADRTEMFTTLSVPVMTRLRQPERRVLDTLVEGGVARSRSDALAWCVRLVGQHEDSWLAELRTALRRVEEVRSEGPAADQAGDIVANCDCTLIANPAPMVYTKAVTGLYQKSVRGLYQSVSADRARLAVAAAGLSRALCRSIVTLATLRYFSPGSGVHSQNPYQPTAAFFSPAAGWRWCPVEEER